MAIAPTQPAKNGDIRNDLLLEVKLEAVLVASLAAGRNNVGSRGLALEIIRDGLLIVCLLYTSRMTPSGN